MGLRKDRFLVSSPESIWVRAVKMESGKENCGKDYHEKKKKDVPETFDLFILLKVKLIKIISNISV